MVKKISILLLTLFLANCATTTYTTQSGKTSNVEFVKTKYDDGWGYVSEYITITDQSNKINATFYEELCFYLDSSGYFNEDNCKSVAFYLYNSYKTQSPVSSFMSTISKDICEDAEVKFDSDIKVFKEGFWGGRGYNKGKVVCPKVESNIKKIKEEKRIAKMKEEQDKRQEALLVSINTKREVCLNIGFANETEDMSNCILQLMLQENQGASTTTVDNSAMVSAMNEQNRIMEKQLRLQKFENTQKQMKTFQYMMDHGKMPPLGYGY